MGTPPPIPAEFPPVIPAGTRSYGAARRTSGSWCSRSSRRRNRDCCHGNIARCWPGQSDTTRDETRTHCRTRPSSSSSSSSYFILQHNIKQIRITTVEYKNMPEGCQRSKRSSNWPPTVFPLTEAGSQIQAGSLIEAGGFYYRKYGILLYN